MYISDLRPNRLATIEATVDQLGPLRQVMLAAGAPKNVRDGRLKDATGEVAIVLWGHEVDLVREGDRIRIVEGWVKDYKGRLQISLGRSGRLDRLEPPSAPGSLTGRSPPS